MPFEPSPRIVTADFSEMTGPLGGQGQKKGHVTHSLDSIPDDSGYADTNKGILREKIAYLEAEIRKRDDQIAQNREGSVKAEALAKVKSQVGKSEVK